MFAIALLPVVFFLGLVTYYRLLQTGVEDVIYARSMSQIQQYFSEIDPDHADLFNKGAVDQVGLGSLGLFRLRWQQFLSSAAVVAIINSVVGGVFIALTITRLLSLTSWLAAIIAAAAAVAIAIAFLRHQWVTWMHVAKALPRQ